VSTDDEYHILNGNTVVEFHMILKTLTYVLAVLVVAEAGYIFLLRRPINRFKLMDDNGYVAFDTESGQLCRTFQPNLKSQAAKSPVPVISGPSNSGDSILDAIRNTPSSSSAEGDAQLDFVRRLPACDDVR
jgi:hypothetical protein